MKKISFLVIGMFFVGNASAMLQENPCTGTASSVQLAPVELQPQEISLHGTAYDMKEQKKESWFKRMIGCLCGDANNDGKIDENDIMPGIALRIEQGAKVASIIDSDGKVAEGFSTAQQIAEVINLNPIFKNPSQEDKKSIS